MNSNANDFILKLVSINDFTVWRRRIFDSIATTIGGKIVQHITTDMSVYAILGLQTTKKPVAYSLEDSAIFRETVLAV